MYFFFIVYFVIFFFQPLIAVTTNSAKIKALYNSLELNSIAKHLAFYELYQNTPEGTKALQEGLALFNASYLPSSTLQAVITLIHKQPNEETPIIAQQDLQMIERLASKLSNRGLKGHYVKSEEEVLQLKPEEIDLARALFISELGNESELVSKMLSYEATIDLMALQILTKLPCNPKPEEIIHAISQFIFHDMGFRFPPQSIYAKNIDQYTFLPSVLDSRKGVCLGVSLLYMCLAQRLNLHLEMITPPGHIYVRYKSGDKEINIETTARGVHMDSEEYLGVNTRSLQQRNLRDVIGLAHFNQASVYWKQEQYDQAIISYSKALKYMPDDPLVTELKGYNHILAGDIETGSELLNKVRNLVPDHSVSKDSTTDDFLNGATDATGLKAIFTEPEDTREAITKKREEIENVLAKYPKFRSGILSLASTWMQLHRADEALKWLERYHELDQEDPTAEYYLAALYAERYQYKKAWEHLERAEGLTKKRDYNPKALKELRKELNVLSPL